jgi:hypothetical protein
MVLHPAHWHLLERCLEDRSALAMAVVPPDLPWYVTQQGVMLVAVYVPEGQQPPLAMPLPPPPTSWQVVRGTAEAQVFHVLAVGPLFHESPEELCHRLGAQRITETSTTSCQYVAPVSHTLPEIVCS